VQRAETTAQQAVTDGLTGLHNRSAFDEAIAGEIERSRRFGSDLGLVLMDLDDFKDVNDDYGHPQGDAVLRAVARVLRETSREIDFAARYGGEEFAVLLPGCTLADAQALLERLRRAMPEDQTVSAGVACWDGAESAEELVGRADAALYRAKRSGRDCLVAA
jgi:diguanylate cyclase (GGDEF)-like protein